MWHQAVDAYEALGDEEAVGRVGLQAAYSLLWAGRWGESFEMAERALAVLGDRSPPTGPGSWPTRAPSSVWRGALRGRRRAAHARRWPSPTSWATRWYGGIACMFLCLNRFGLDAPGRVRRGGAGIGRAASGRR